MIGRTSCHLQHFSAQHSYLYIQTHSGQLELYMQVEELSEGLMWGRPHLLAADGEALSDFEAGEANEDAMAALCQVWTVRKGL